MKTLENLYNEILKSNELKTAFANAVKENKVAEFLKANDCDATLEETTEFLKGIQKSGELSDDELDNVAGGLTADYMRRICEMNNEHNNSESIYVNH